MKPYTPPATVDDLQYYITPPHPCSYLPNRMSRVIFLDPMQTVNQQLLTDLSQMGFRRSGDFIYRPECLGCQQCLSSRIPVHQFLPNSVQKKAWKRNQDLQVHIRPIEQSTPQHYALYEQYIRTRHADGDMFPPSKDQFEKFLLKSNAQSFFLELWHEDKLYSVAACDILNDGLSAVYTFFDPEQSRRSLGVYSILQQIEYAKTHHLQYVYLGYWVPHSHKMNYKIQYLPLEIFVDGHWVTIDHSLSPENIQQIGDILTRSLLHFKCDDLTE